MKLFGFPTPRNKCVWALVDHLGLDVEQISVDLTKGAQKAADYLAINPNGRVPTLVDDDFVLWEHAAIMQYLCEQAASPLSPATTRARADATRWISWIQMHWVPGSDLLGFEFLAKPALGLGDPDPAVIERGRAQMREPVAVLDGHLRRTKCMLGDDLSFVDFFVGGSVAHWQPCQMPFDDADHILRWYSQLQAIPAWQTHFGT